MSKVTLCLLWFCFPSLSDWLKKLVPLTQPIRCKTKINCDFFARVFSRLTLSRQGGGEGGGRLCPHRLWTSITFFISELNPSNLATFPNIYLGTIWHRKCCPSSLTLPWQPSSDRLFFQNFKFSPDPRWPSF